VWGMAAHWTPPSRGRVHPRLAGRPADVKSSHYRNPSLCREERTLCTFGPAKSPLLSTMSCPLGKGVSGGPAGSWQRNFLKNKKARQPPPASRRHLPHHQNAASTPPPARPPPPPPPPPARPSAAAAATTTTRAVDTTTRPPLHTTTVQPCTPK
jgi:hypothetical protein